jgi:hypothetical protein
MANRYRIKDGLGNVINTIKAPEEFVKKHYTNYELIIPVIKESDPEVQARMWRNNMLDKSDVMVEHLPDHPDHTKWKDWRITLRNWPSTKDFPKKLPAWK